ncbi:MAG: ATP-binding protein [Candidatus Goldbacteria bacterium]|nr:ATP-binding protein [Candidatus Goldiibacteriota bacterium]
MKKSTVMISILIIVFLSFGIPVGLLYYYDNLRITQLNNMQSEILWAENQKERDLIKEQLKEKIKNINLKISLLSDEKVKSRYSAILDNRIIKDTSYSQKIGKKKITDEFLKQTKKLNADIILLYTNGSSLIANKPELNTLSFNRNNKFLQTLPSKKISRDINFSAGIAEFFIPVLDSKERLVSVLYVKENISDISEEIRKETQSAHGYNLIFDMAGKTMLHTDKTKENTENIFIYPDLKSIITEEVKDENIKEATYNNFKGLIGYKKDEALEIITAVFTPYVDYSFMRKKTKKFDSVFMDKTFFVPVYVILLIVFFAILLFANFISNLPFTPLRKIIRALSHIDEETFEEYLPKIKKGFYKKIIDAILILRSRVKASEEKAGKLSQMAKELEEEMAREAAKSDTEISQLRDAIKIVENTKASLEEENIKLKKEIEKQKSDFDKKIAEEKAILNQKIMDLNKEIEKFKNDLKKAQESAIPVEKENMRMEAILMMNTELKGVLSVIKTYISSVLGGEGKITDAQQQFLGVVINKSARLERLINDLTELARLEKGEIKLARQPIDVNTIIQDVIFAIQPQADIKKIELKVNFSPTLTNCLGDAARLSNVITQLLNQALKVSPRGSKIIIETKEEKERVLMKFTDFGMSMPQTKANSLFINFHGPESSAGPEFANTGLRFPIIKAIINNMGGEIWIESEIGKGKTFIISLIKSIEKGQEIKIPEMKKVEPTPEKLETAKQQPLGIKIQRNIMQDISMETPKKENTTPKETISVNDLLSFKEADLKPKVNLPGKDVNVPQDLLKKESKEAKLPDELPPLPDLDNGKGII